MPVYFIHSIPPWDTVVRRRQAAGGRKQLDKLLSSPYGDTSFTLEGSVLGHYWPCA